MPCPTECCCSKCRTQLSTVVINLNDGPEWFKHCADDLWAHFVTDSWLYTPMPIWIAARQFDIFQYRSVTDPWKWAKDGIPGLLAAWHEFYFKQNNLFFDYSHYNWHNSRICQCSGPACCVEANECKIVTEFTTDQGRRTCGHTIECTAYNYSGLLAFHVWMIYQYEFYFPGQIVWR